MIALVLRYPDGLVAEHVDESECPWTVAQRLADDFSVVSADIYRGRRVVAGVLPSDGVYRSSPWVAA